MGEQLTVSGVLWAYPAPVYLSGEKAMAGRSLQKSEAYATLSVGGGRVLDAVEQLAGRGAVAITLEQLMELTDLCRSSVRRGIRQCELVGFIAVAMGPRRVNLFKLCDGWKSLDAAEAKRRMKLAKEPTPPRQSSAPPRAVRPVKVPVEVEQPPPRAVPSMPQVQWLGR
jgi:hypothetical protein